MQAAWAAGAHSVGIPDLAADAARSEQGVCPSISDRLFAYGKVGNRRRVVGDSIEANGLGLTISLVLEYGGVANLNALGIAIRTKIYSGLISPVITRWPRRDLLK
jgi:hypothetical protein